MAAWAGPVARAEQAGSQERSFQAGMLDAGGFHTCALLDNGTVRCWGFGFKGELGYANTNTIGNDETPASVGPVYLGPGRIARAITAGSFHSCALLDNATVRCWGAGANGRLGYASTNDIGDNETPGSVGPIDLGPLDLGPGRTAKAITAGADHTCALLDNNTVRCWGAGANGRLGYSNTNDIGDNETPGSVGPVDLGPGRTAKAITAGGLHTCALLDNNAVRCWGYGGEGRLGYSNTNDIGDNETPGSVGPVDLGPAKPGQERTARAISAGYDHTCAVLDNVTVRCWGFGASGRLGYVNTNDIGDDETPGSVGPVDLGTGRTAKAITAGGYPAAGGQTCALLDNASVRCWGSGGNGRLGYGNTDDIGDDETPGSVGPVDLGPGRTALAITAGGLHTCAMLDNGTVRCWGANNDGQLGYGNTNDIGDNPGETPGSVGPVQAGRGLAAALADLSVDIGADQPNRQVGETVVLTVTAANAGPDPVSFPVIDVHVPGGLQVTGNAPSQGSFDAGTGRWQPGAIASGAGATLALTATVTSTGPLTTAVEVADAELLDPDSIIGGGLPGEDDHDAVTVLASVTGPAGPAGPAGSLGPAGPAGPQGPAGTQGPRAKLAAVLGQDRYRVRRRRALRLRYGATLAGRVTAQLLRGRRVIARAQGNARAGRNTITLKPPTAGVFTLRLTVTATGQTATDTARVTVTR
jgi:alpha-tubulin suppressor-like RCC1 family protein